MEWFNVQLSLFEKYFFKMTLDMFILARLDCEKKQHVDIFSPPVCNFMYMKY